MIDAQLEAMVNDCWAAAVENAKKPTRGRVVRVVTASKKVPSGVVGKVGWIGADRFTHTMTRLGVYADDGVIHYVNAREVEVIDWEQYLPARATIQAQVELAYAKYGALA